MAESLGARPFYRLRRATLPLLLPYLVAAFSMSFALSDRGAIFDAATMATILGVGTLRMVAILSKVSNRAAVR